MRPYDALRQRHVTTRLNFLGAALDGQLTFTRATTANFFGANGLAQSAASGAPRFDYDPVALTPLGIMMEDARTNICLRSSTPSSSTWVRVNVNGSASNQTGPDGTSSYGTVTASAANGTILQTITVVDATLYQFSIRLKRLVGAGNIQITTDNGVTWNTLAVTSTLTRFTQSQLSSGTVMIVGLRIVTNTDSVVFGGTQLEAGNYPTSELSTAGSTTSRNVEAMSLALPGPTYSDLFFTMMIEAQIIGLPPSTTTRLVRLVGPLAANAFLINIDSSGGVFGTDTSNSVSQSTSIFGAIVAGTVHKIALSYGPYGLIIAMDGVLCTTPVAYPAQGIIQMQSIDFGPASNSGSFYHRRFNFWRSAVTPDRLALITA